MTDKAVYCCSVSVCALINDVILFTYFVFIHLAVPQGTAELRLGITGLRVQAPTPTEAAILAHKELSLCFAEKKG
jgi:hypothetical protein